MKGKKERLTVHLLVRSKKEGSLNPVGARDEEGWELLDKKNAKLEDHVHGLLRRKH